MGMSRIISVPRTNWIRSVTADAKSNSNTLLHSSLGSLVVAVTRESYLTMEMIRYVLFGRLGVIDLREWGSLPPDVKLLIFVWRNVDLQLL